MRSDLGGTYDSLALKLASEVRIAGNYTLERPNSPPSILLPPSDLSNCRRDDGAFVRAFRRAGRRPNAVLRMRPARGSKKRWQMDRDQGTGKFGRQGMGGPTRHKERSRHYPKVGGCAKRRRIHHHDGTLNGPNHAISRGGRRHQRAAARPRRSKQRFPTVD